MVWDLVGGRGFEPPLPRCERVKCDGQEKGTSVGSIPIARSLGKGYESYILVVGGGDFLRLNFVLEIVRVETIEAAFGRFCLRIHQEADRSAFGAGKRDVMREVIRHPVHFPSAEQA